MIQVRRAVATDAAGIAYVHVESWRETYRGLVPDDYLDRLSVITRTRAHADRLAGEKAEATFVAETRDGIVGFAIAGLARGAPGPNWGEVQAIYLLDSMKRRGVGRLLMAACSDWLVAQERLPFMVWVLTANFRATGFYQHLGGRPVAHKIERFASALLPETAFGFETPITVERVAG